MSAKTDKDDILDDFPTEPSLGPETLRSYVQRFPSLAVELTDLYHELRLVDLSTAVDGVPFETNPADVGAQQSAAAVMSALSGTNLRGLAQDLGLPRDFVAGFRDRKIRLGSIPGALLGNLARTAKVGVHQLIYHLQDSTAPTPQMAYKADGKPRGSAPVEFDDFVAGLNLDESELEALNKLSEADGTD